MIQVKSKVYGPQVIRELQTEINAGLNRVASAATELCREAVNIPVFPRSQPGEPPRRETGWGRKNIKWTRANIAAGQGSRLGVDVSQTGPHGKTAFYMLLLEFGTRRIAPRPWLLSTVLRNLANLAVAFAARRQRSPQRSAA